MSKNIGTDACPSCREKGNDSKGDNLTLYDDDHGYCFACGYYTPDYKLDNTKEHTIVESSNVSYEYISNRGISSDTMNHYGAYTKLSNSSPTEIYFPFGSYTQIRGHNNKNISTIGNGDDIKLFGQDSFGAGSAKAVTVTEGAYDALSVYQMLGSKYPAVSVRSSSTARRDCERSRSYLNSFDQIYLCFDGDEAGQRAAKEVASLFDVNKVFHVQLSKYKDANEYLQAGDAKEFTNVWWNSKKFMPKGIVSDYKAIENILAAEGQKSIASYPFPTLESFTYGIRLGELVLFTALEKVGKTEVLRAIEYHLLKTTDENIGIIHLEEQEKRSVQGLVGYELGIPCHLPDSGSSVADQLEAYRKITKKDGRLHFYTHFGSDDPDTILDIIRYLVAVCHCKFVFLDHITLLVTGQEESDERKKLDYVSTRLAEMTRELNFTLFLVSHVNDNGQTRGSRNIGKVADLLLHLDRDIESPSEDTRNTTRLTCRGNRFAGTTGPAGELSFDRTTYRVTEKEKPAGQFDYSIAA